MTYDDTKAENLNKKTIISYARFHVIFKLVPLLWNAKYTLLTKTSVRIVSSKHTPTEECLQPLWLFYVAASASQRGTLWACKSCLLLPAPIYLFNI